MGNYEECLEKIIEISDFKKWEIGDEELFVFNDAAIHLKLSESRAIKITTLPITRIDMDMDMNLYKEEI